MFYKDMKDDEKNRKLEIIKIAAAVQFDSLTLSAIDSLLQRLLNLAQDEVTRSLVDDLLDCRSIATLLEQG